MKTETITELYEKMCEGKSDIQAHLPIIHKYASDCETAVEFGVRDGLSTIAILASGCKLYSYDINECPIVDKLRDINFTFIKADTSKPIDMPYEIVDMAFVDTLHTYEQVKKELEHLKNVRKYIIFHDTVLFGDRDESPGWQGGMYADGPGINKAIQEFMVEQNCWAVDYSSELDNGLLVIKRI